MKEVFFYKQEEIINFKYTTLCGTYSNKIYEFPDTRDLKDRSFDNMP